MTTSVDSSDTSNHGAWSLRGVSRRALATVALVAAVAIVTNSACYARSPAGSVVATAKSAINGKVTVTDENGVRVMRFGTGARQTAVIVGKPQHLELEYTKATMAALAMVNNPKRVLIVGLGGGAIPAFLRHHYPKLIIDAVDIDPVVVDMAKRHFNFREDARMKAFVGDGRKFIEDGKHRWDIIILDAFSGSAIPKHLATRQFLEAVKAKLAPGGVVAANIWQPRYNTQYYPMRKTYRAAFKHVNFVQVSRGSDIFLATMDNTAWTGAALRKRAEVVGKAGKFHFDLASMVRRGYFADQGDLRGKVLEDPKK